MPASFFYLNRHNKNQKSFSFFISLSSQKDVEAIDLYSIQKLRRIEKLQKEVLLDQIGEFFDEKMDKNQENIVFL